MNHLPPLVAVLTSCGCFLTPGLPADEELLDGPLDGLSEGQLAVFLRGDEGFNRQFRREDGLGPVFNATSCATCHPADGRGHPEFGFLRYGREIDGAFDPMIEWGGPQLQDRAVPGATPETLPAEATAVTLMIAPPVTGLGLLEAIPDADLLARADHDDEDGDGISGRVHWRTPTDELRKIAEIGASFGPRVMEYEDGYIGRFGRRGSNISLLHQAVSAYHQDIGITSDFAMVDLSSAEGIGAHDTVSDPELGSGELADVAFYLRTLRAPARRSPDARDVRAGEELFEAIGCADCHVPTWRT